MRNLVFSLTLFLTITVFSQQRSYHKDAIKYFELNGTEQQYRTAIDQMFDLLKKQYADQNIPDSVWQELQKDKAPALTNIKALLVSAYRGNFTQEDIESLVAFYSSDTGKQVVQDPTELTSEQNAILSEFYSSNVGQKLQNQSESLKMMVSEVSELWSRDLYKKAVDKLKAKGYKMPQ